MGIGKNQRFGRLVTISPAEPKNGRKVWNCICDCGNTAIVAGRHLSSGASKSCGCYRSEKIRKLRESEAAPFETRVVRVPSGCLEWTGSRDRRGYGTLRSKGIDRKAHRVAFEAAHGPIPEGMHVCHTCDNPPCCEPSHLFLGTPQQNSSDMATKGRSAKGASNANAKLSGSIVQRIRRLAQDGMPQQKIADILGIHQTTVSRVVLRQTWEHVE